MTNFLSNLRPSRWVSIGLRFTIGLCGALTAQQALAQPILSFPGAEGAGRFTKGGRGTATVATTVYEVTSLADTNTPGTLRYALSQSTTTAPHRTVVFRVCGTIRLTSRLNIPRNTTLAGQTAPGDGICISDKQVALNGDNIIIRFLRFRLGDRLQNGGMVNGSGDDDALNGIDRKNIVVDHCTMSWSTDEACTFYGAAADSLTLQWNIISEPLNYSYHFETGDTDYQRHGFGGIWGGKKASFHHNLFAHCLNRTPRWNGTRYGAAIGSENCDFRNNVIYNWGSNNVYGGEGGNYNIVNNYYKYGPSTNTNARSRVINPYKQNMSTTQPALPYPRIFLAGNYVDGSANNTRRNWLGATMEGGSAADTALSRTTTPFAIGPVVTQTATDAYNVVLQNVGCVLPVRDALDARIVNDVRNRTGAIIDVQGGFPHGTPYSVSQVAWPVLTCGAAPTDTDRDGMPDAWETGRGLNPNNATDRNTRGADGYTMLENYLNSLVTTTVLGTKATGAVPTLQAYPNPATDQLTLTHPRAGRKATVTVYGFEGRKVAVFAVAAGTEETVVKLNQLAEGSYLLRYVDENQQVTTKISRQ